MFSQKDCLSRLKYDVKTSKMTFLLNMSNKCMSKSFSKNLFIFVRPIIEQTDVHFKDQLPLPQAR